MLAVPDRQEPDVKAKIRLLILKCRADETEEAEITKSSVFLLFKGSHSLRKEYISRYGV
jgi:hypothetical protein